MAGLCEGGNEPPGSLKASNSFNQSFVLKFLPSDKVEFLADSSPVCAGALEQGLVQHLPEDPGALYCITEPDISAVNDDHGERFHQEISEMERRYKGRPSSSILADYC
ncbi:hypothetical protein ANN_13315 [Periplaneta americana]|uniref:Uncharacterized protein n=1 Tax=Periplaneta americana TaxID=6978 RepID=A0ABQ8TK29_PERAM|nr:hypothetical protein ANN_13315 [Periplaneta americana]